MSKPSADWSVLTRLKTRQIVLLVYLDQCGSVLRAAEAAGMTQPAASKLLRDLERTFGVPLFDRGARGVTPTWYGEILIRRARSALAEFSRAQDEIATLQSGSTGEVRIGTLLNPGTNLVPMAVARLKQLQPRILVTIDLDDNQPLIEKLLKGELDIVVGRIPGWRDVAELEAESLADERHAVIASTRHPFADRSNLRLEDLAGQGWILPSPGSPLRDRLLSHFMVRDLPAPNNVVESSSLAVITNLLRVTSMVAPLPKEAVQSYCDAGLLTVLIDDLGIDVGAFGLVRRRERPLSPGAQAIVKALRDVASQLYPQKRRASNGGTAVRFTSRGELPT